MQFPECQKKKHHRMTLCTGRTRKRDWNQAHTWHTCVPEMQLAAGCTSFAVLGPKQMKHARHAWHAWMALILCFACRACLDGFHLCFVVLLRQGQHETVLGCLFRWAVLMWSGCWLSRENSVDVGERRGGVQCRELPSDGGQVAELQAHHHTRISVRKAHGNSKQ